MVTAVEMDPHLYWAGIQQTRWLSVHWLRVPRNNINVHHTSLLGNKNITLMAKEAERDQGMMMKILNRNKKCCLLDDPDGIIMCPIEKELRTCDASSFTEYLFPTQWAHASGGSFFICSPQTPTWLGVSRFMFLRAEKTNYSLLCDPQRGRRRPSPEDGNVR